MPAANFIDHALAVLCAPSALAMANGLIALAAAIIAFGAANRMNEATEKTIIFAFGTTGAGLLGFCAGIWFPGAWQEVCATLLVGGVGALLVGTRRQTIWLPAQWMPRISMAMTVSTWGLFFVGIR